MIEISVILSVYNNEKTLSHAVDSVLNQTFNNFELIIIDDASTDSSHELLSKYQNTDSRIILLKNDKNIGLTKSLNIGIAKSRSDLIARIDGDDWWYADKLEMQYQLLKENPEIGIVGTNGRSINQINNKESFIKKPEDNDEILNILPCKSPFIHSSIVFRKSIINFYNEKYYTSQDYELYSRLLLLTKGYNIQIPLTNRLTHGKNSISTGKIKKQKINNIKIRFSIFKKHKISIWKLHYFFEDLCILILPVFVKKIKNRLRKIN